MALVRDVGTCSGFLRLPGTWPLRKEAYCRKADLLSLGNQPHGSWNANVHIQPSPLHCSTSPSLADQYVHTMGSYS